MATRSTKPKEPAPTDPDLDVREAQEQAAVLADQPAVAAVTEAAAEPEKPKRGSKKAEAKAEPDGDKVPTTTEEEPSPDEIEQHRRDVIARAPEEKDRPANIIGRLAQITGLLGVIAKTGRNDFHGYRYATEAALVEEIRPLLSLYGIRIHMSLHNDPEAGWIAHERLTHKRFDRSGNLLTEADTLTKISMVFWFQWWNDKEKKLEETTPQYFMGYGDDNSDKGIYKALTGTEKYFLMKSFLVATGDDPEGDKRADARAAARDTETQVDVRGGDRQRGQTRGQQRGTPQAGPGGRQPEASKPQVRQLGELLRQAGIKKTEDAAALIGRLLGREIALDDADKAASLAKVTEALNPRDMGKLVHDLRQFVEQSTGAATGDAAESSEAQKEGEAEDATVGPQTTGSTDGPTGSPSGESTESSATQTDEAPDDEDLEAGPIS